MNPQAILGLVSDLYSQVTALKQENAALKQRMQVMMQASEMHQSQQATPEGGEQHD